MDNETNLSGRHVVIATSTFALIISALLATSSAKTYDHTPGNREASADRVAPEAPLVVAHEIHRGQAQDGHLSRIIILLSATDDRTLPQDLRYSLVLTDGNIPEGLRMPDRPVYARSTYENGRRVGSIALTWDDGASDVQDPLNFSLVVFAIDRSGNKSPASDTLRVAHSGHYIDIVFGFGMRAKNQLDTTRGIFIKDMVLDPSLTLDLTLTNDERAQVLAKAEEIGFFRLPRVIIPERTFCDSTPCEHFYLKMIVGRGSHQVSWDDCSCWEMESLRELRLMLQEMIKSKDEYKQSPEPRGAYY